MTVNFTGTGGVLTLTTNTESGKYPAEIYTYNGASASLYDKIIQIQDYGVEKERFQFFEIGLIAGVAPTDIGDAYTKILAIILTAAGT